MDAHRVARREGAAWLWLCAMLGLASAALWAAQALSPQAGGWIERELVFRATGWSSRPWTLWSASLLHLSLMHLAANLLALGALAALGIAWRLPRMAVVAVLLSWPLSTALLLCWPETGAYRGLSGLNHAIALVCWSFAAIGKVAKPWSFALLAGVVLKLLSEHAWSRPIAFDPDWGFAVVHAAHLSGALVGAAIGLTSAAVDRFRLRRAR